MPAGLMPATRGGPHVTRLHSRKYSRGLMWCNFTSRVTRSSPTVSACYTRICGSATHTHARSTASSPYTGSIRNLNLPLENRPRLDIKAIFFFSTLGVEHAREKPSLLLSLFLFLLITFQQRLHRASTNCRSLNFHRNSHSSIYDRFYLRPRMRLSFPFENRSRLLFARFEGRPYLFPLLRTRRILIYLEEEEKEENRPSARMSRIAEYILPRFRHSDKVHDNRSSIVHLKRPGTILFSYS